MKGLSIISVVFIWNFICVYISLPFCVEIRRNLWMKPHCLWSFSLYIALFDCKWFSLSCYTLEITNSPPRQNGMTVVFGVCVLLEAERLFKYQSMWNRITGPYNYDGGCWSYIYLLHWGKVKSMHEITLHRKW